MTRKSFEHELEVLNDRICSMAQAVSQALYYAVESLKQHQLVLANTVIEGDKAITREYYAIEETALTLIATQAPVASDLRRIAAVMNIAAELERMGDHAKGIARLVDSINDHELVAASTPIAEMSEHCREMLRQVVTVFQAPNANQAREIADQDDAIDDLYHKLFLNLIKVMNENSAKADNATYLLWVAHNLERFADRIVNICERIIFVATGEMVEIIGHRNG